MFYAIAPLIVLRSLPWLLRRICRRGGLHGGNLVGRSQHRELAVQCVTRDAALFLRRRTRLSVGSNSGQVAICTIGWLSGATVDCLVRPADAKRP